MSHQLTNATNYYAAKATNYNDSHESTNHY